MAITSVYGHLWIVFACLFQKRTGKLRNGHVFSMILHSFHMDFVIVGKHCYVKVKDYSDSLE